ncbi:hypothetical protein EB796_022713 [Bugula neritina]|uniref:Reverse transcriptase domain-containing protein n=1 Tax=Bugula neritina TaxID=10212 RepID=A0A7J7J0I5_BUGNE|nr:hypothetical protein EB796_022713 [Bugula neritina]
MALYDLWFPSMCKSVYAKLAGLSQHLRRSHTERYHHEEAKTGAKKVRWTNGMLIELAREEVQLEKEGRSNINIRLQERFREHTIEAIKGVRNKNTRYKDILEKEREGEQNKEMASAPLAHDEQGDFRKALKEAINETHISGVSRQNLHQEVSPLKQQTNKKNIPEEIPVSENQTRRRLYKKTQQLFRKDPGILVDQILLGTLGQNKGCLPEGAEAYWEGLLGRGPPDETMPRCSEQHPQLNELLAPIVAKEVEQALAVKNKGAPGPDMYTWKKLKNNTKAEELASFFNLWLLCGKMPSTICEGRTTLVPKVVGTRDPSEYRPVTVCSVFTRLFHSILGNRLERFLPISQRQKGFRKGDGIFMNALILQRCITNVKKKGKNLRVAFIDLRKAFDSVGHDALWTSCRRLGHIKNLGQSQNLVNSLEIFVAYSLCDLPLSSD